MNFFKIILALLAILLAVSSCMVSNKPIDRRDDSPSPVAKQVEDEYYLEKEILIKELTENLHDSDHLIYRLKNTIIEDNEKISNLIDALDKTNIEIYHLKNSANIEDRFKPKYIYKDSLKYIYPQSPLNYIAFDCPVVMKEENTYEVTAMVALLLDEYELKNELLTLVNEVRKERNEIPITQSEIVTKEIFFGSHLKIKLLDPADKFTIIIPDNYPTDETLINVFDENINSYSDEKFTWKWLITPKANTQGSASLKFIITLYDKDYEPLSSKERDFKISIKFKQSFLSNTWNYANSNPGWVFAGIITPIISFLAGFVTNRRKKFFVEKDVVSNVE